MLPQPHSSLPTPLSGIGHNHPPKLNEEIETLTRRLGESHNELVARFCDLELGCARVPDPIDNEAVAALTADFIAQCQLHIRGAEAAHKGEKEFYLASGREIDAFFKRRCDTLNRAVAPVVASLKAYRDRLAAVDRQRREIACQAAAKAARVATEEAARHRVEAERLARDGTSHNDRLRAAEHWILAEEAAERAEAARRHIAGSCEPTRVRGDYGATAYVARSWSFEVIDLGQVPRTYVKIDVGSVKDAIAKRGIRNIPGLRIFQSEALRVRGAV